MNNEVVIWDDTVKTDIPIHQYTRRYILHKIEVCIVPIWDLHISYSTLFEVTKLQSVRGFERLRIKNYFRTTLKMLAASSPETW